MNLTKNLKKYTLNGEKVLTFETFLWVL